MFAIGYQRDGQNNTGTSPIKFGELRMADRKQNIMPQLDMRDLFAVQCCACECDIFFDCFQRFITYQGNGFTDTDKANVEIICNTGHLYSVDISLFSIARQVIRVALKKNVPSKWWQGITYLPLPPALQRALLYR